MPRQCRSADARASPRSGRKVPAPLSPPKNVQRSSRFANSSVKTVKTTTSAPSRRSLRSNQADNQAAARQTNAFPILPQEGGGHDSHQRVVPLQSTGRRSFLLASPSENATSAASSSINVCVGGTDAFEADAFETAGDGESGLKRIASEQATSFATPSRTHKSNRPRIEAAGVAIEDIGVGDG